MDVDGDGTDAERFAVARSALVVHVARLLSPDSQDPQELAIDGLRRVIADDRRLNTDADRMAAVLGSVARAAQRASEPRRLRPSGGLDLRDVLPEPAPEDAGAGSVGADREVVVRGALQSLTGRERAVVVLHLVGGLDMRRISRALRRPTAVTRRDLEQGVSFLGAAAAGQPNPAEDMALVARALRLPDATASSPEFAARLRESVRTSPPRPSRSRWVLVAAATTIIVSLVAGAVVLNRDENSPPAAAPAFSPGPAAAGPFPVPKLPDTISGLKLVGFEGLMLAVPDSWRQLSSRCRTTAHDVVLYPTERDRHPCLAHADGATVSFGRASLLDLPSVNRSYGDGPIDRVVVTSMIERRSGFVQFAALLDADVVVAVRAPDRRQVSMIVSTVQRLPRGCVLVPDVLGLEPTLAGSTLTFAGLHSLVFADSSVSGTDIPLEVAKQTPEVGTVMPSGATVNLGVAPR
jgi:DNA-directed RNA polymerase specialized sigma24 family protein